MKQQEEKQDSAGEVDTRTNLINNTLNNELLGADSLVTIESLHNQIMACAEERTFAFFPTIKPF